MPDNPQFGAGFEPREVERVTEGPDAAGRAPGGGGLLVGDHDVRVGRPDHGGNAIMMHAQAEHGDVTKFVRFVTRQVGTNREPTKEQDTNQRAIGCPLQQLTLGREKQA